MDISDIDVNATLERFKKEMDKGLEKVGPIRVCSIPMIPTYLNPSVRIKINEKVIVIDAGGTNLRVGVAFFDGDLWHIDEVQEHKMPGLDREYSKYEFFNYIADKTIPFLDQASSIGFCFSYRCQMNENLDGSLIAWAKEIKAKEVVGAFVGCELLKAIKKYSSVEREVVVLNDTAAVLLGGMLEDGAKECDKYIGAIYGTGFNCCYEEKVSNIKKINKSSDALMIINTETGNFNGFSRGIFDDELTNDSLYPDEALTEKMSSGRYLATLIYKAFVKAKVDGLFTSDVVIPDFASFDLPLVSRYLAGSNELDKCFSKDADKAIFKEIAFKLINRASIVVATTISAFVIKSNVKRIGIIIEGSTFYKLPTFKESFEEHLKMILEKNNISYKLFDGRNKVLLGAAIDSMMK